MQPELPWNVAGIPTEAREAARAAARREGLSVGEWMTRRILRGFPDAATDTNDNWRSTVVEAAVPSQPIPLASPQETPEMLERVSDSEAEAHNAHKAIDDQVKAVARRLETAERNQTENNRAMTQAATQINTAAREQAQAFEQTTTHVTALSERLVRLERHVQSNGMKDAVKALHLGLSRVAEQIAQTANQSASQIAALATNVDSLTMQVVAASEKAEAVAQAVEANVTAVDERIRVVERSACSSASTLDHTMETVERLKAHKESVENEVRQQSAAVSQLKDNLDQLSGRIAASESEHTRLDDAIARLHAQYTDNPLDQRLSGIEHVLTDIMNRVEQAERTTATTHGTVEQTMRELAAGFEAGDQRNRDTIRQLQSAVEDATDKIAAVEEKLTAAHAGAVMPIIPAAPMQAAPEVTAAEPIPAPEALAAEATPAIAEAALPQHILDAPPFPEHMAHDFTANLPPLVLDPLPDFPPPAHDSAPDFQPLSETDPVASPLELDSVALPLELDEPVAAPNSETPDTAEPQASHEPFGAAVSFLDAARRSAKAAAMEKEQAHGMRTPMGSLPWMKPGRAEQSEARSKRYAVAGSVFGVAVAASLAGVVLTRSMSSPHPHLLQVASVSMPVIAHQNVPTKTAAKPTPAASPSVKQSTSVTATVGNPNVVTSVAKAPETTNQLMTTSIAPKAAAALPATPSPAAAAVSGMQKLVAMANTGDSRAQLLLGLKYLEGNGVAANEAESARWLSRAAQQGEPLAQYRLGTLYERGRGLPASAQQATHWYELAAKQGNRKAMHNLAIAFAEGSGEPKDEVKAAMWFARAANLGLADSQFNLAVLYERGMGVKQSLVDAYKWYLIAAAQGDAESKTRAEALSTQIGDADRAAAQQAASAFRSQPLNPSANSPPAFG
jgi:localization factor PodJL